MNRKLQKGMQSKMLSKVKEIAPIFFFTHKSNICPLKKIEVNFIAI